MKRTETVYLYDDDDLHEIERLREAVSSALLAQDVPRVADGSGSAAEAAAAHDAFVTAANEHALAITVQSIGHKKWRDLIAAHPPRMITVTGEDGVSLEETHPDDVAGFNSETFPDALTEACVDQVTVLDDLNIVDFNRVFTAAYRVNTEAVDPKADLSSRVAQISVETSESPALLA